MSQGRCCSSIVTTLLWHFKYVDSFKYFRFNLQILFIGKKISNDYQPLLKIICVFHFLFTIFLTVNLEECLQTSDLIRSSDPDFIVRDDGSLFSANAISLSSPYRNFTILLQDTQRHVQKKMLVILQSTLKKVRNTHIKIYVSKLNFKYSPQHANC